MIPTIEGKRIKLRPKRLGDAVDDHLWRRDPELTRLDAATPTEQSFASFFINFKDELLQPAYDEGRYAVETLDGRHIGNCSYYHYDPRRNETEVGILIGDRDYWDKGYGTEAVSLLLGYLFGEKKLQRIYLRTLSWNTRAQKSFDKAGFRRCGETSTNGHRFVLFELLQKDWEKQARPPDDGATPEQPPPRNTVDSNQ